MKSLKIASLLFLTAMTMSAQNPTVQFERSGNYKVGNSVRHKLSITLNNPQNVDMLCFNQFARRMNTLTQGDTVVEIVPGYYYIRSERFGKTNEPVTVDIEVIGRGYTTAYKPDGFHVVMKDGAVAGVESKRVGETVMMPLNFYNDADRMVYADSIYDFNETLANARQLNPYDILPSFKKVTLTGKGYYTAGKPIEEKIVKNDNPEYYKITITPQKAVIEAVNKQGLKMARRVLERRLLAVNNGKLPSAIIEDWPDFQYRGVMIDIARNYQTPENMNNLVELLADYRLNRLHFHCTDDEAWRLEIAGLPELTEVGSRRGFTLDEHDYLAQIFAGDGNAKSRKGTANGYFKRADFINLLRHCDSLGIKVIPEIESPGHARAAIVAMENRYRKTGDASYRLIEDGDTSVYTSAQSFHDNLMNPALEGTYNFMNHVLDDVVAMYKEAGVELPGIHIGGDEVPEGAWDGSASAMKMAADKGVSGRHGLQGEYVKRITKMMADKGITVYGWEEIGSGYDADFNREVAPRVGGLNVWHSAYTKGENLAHKIVRGGYPIILSNVDYFYLDQIYAPHSEENGLLWGGIVDEFRTLAGEGDVLCPPSPEIAGHVLGVQGQIFSETIRSYPQLQQYLFPKMLGLAERGWNSKKTYSNAEFNRVVSERELPNLHKEGVAFHLRAPGIKEINGKLHMNTPYNGAVIRYTLDGTDPTDKSPVYTAPIAPGNAKQVRASMEYLGEKSTVSVLNR